VKKQGQGFAMVQKHKIIIAEGFAALQKYKLYIAEYFAMVQKCKKIIALRFAMLRMYKLDIAAVIAALRHHIFINFIFYYYENSYSQPKLFAFAQRNSCGIS
jgi:hypothetical protein